MATVVRIEERPMQGTFSAGKTWTAAVLDCGHAADGGFKGEVFVSEVGDDGKSIGWVPAPVVGDEVECKHCVSETRQREAALRDLPGLIERAHHTRWRRHGILFYGLDSDSPTGVVLIGSIPLSMEAEYVERVRAMGRSHLTPLSPTERS